MNSLPLLRLYIYGRHTSKAGTITNEAVGDDTYELVGTAPDLRAYAESGLEAQSKKPADCDRVHYERVYRNMLDLLDTADLSYYEVAPPASWRDLEVYGVDGERLGTLGEMVDGDDAGLVGIVLATDTGAISEWPQHFIAGPCEEPAWDTPKVPVDWSGLRVAMEPAPVYRTRYHGGPYGEGGEAGPDTDNPRQLADSTLRGAGQWLEATAPDGTITRYHHSPTTGRLQSVPMP